MTKSTKAMKRPDVARERKEPLRRGICALRKVSVAELEQIARERIARGEAMRPIEPSVKLVAAQIRDRVQRDGFAVVRELVPTTLVDELRRQVYAAVARGGLEHRARGDASAFHLAHVPADLIKFNSRAFVARLASGRPFRALVDHALKALRPVTGPAWPIQAEHGRWLRLGMPRGLNRRMPPHQDIFYLPGSEKFMTVWMPLHHCPRGLGGLRVVPRSHLHGAFFHDGKNGVPVRGARLTWKSFDLEVGDAIIFDRHLLHASGINRSKNQVRFSFDFRLAML
ncbi:MAG: phytanoyl-CoA dioxygenase family protein [Myxococcales bacterium]|nr:phytanoyl-CoA dioxygenase family protein [Myxococcales bacterium]